MIHNILILNTIDKFLVYIIEHGSIESKKVICVDYQTCCLYTFHDYLVVGTFDRTIVIYRVNLTSFDFEMIHNESFDAFDHYWSTISTSFNTISLGCSLGYKQ